MISPIPWLILFVGDVREDVPILERTYSVKRMILLYESFNSIFF